MKTRRSGDTWLGLFAILFAVMLVFVWIPLDTETGLTHKVRRQVTLGDSLAPTLAGMVILLGGFLTFLKPNPTAPTLGSDNLKWIGMLLLSSALSLTVMRYAGPILAELFSDQPYRNLRATPPWSYLGYLLGGTLLVGGLISVVRGKSGLSPVLIGLIASLVIALLYDLPFDDLQLPPNGDV